MIFELVLKRMEQEMKLRNYSVRTRRNYLKCVEIYLKQKEKIDFDEENLRSFLESKLEKGGAPETANLYLCSIKFFYKEILRYRGKINIRFARRNLRLPVVLSKEEVGRILEVIKNKKHYCLVALAYGAGLRAGEVVNLKIRDIDFERKVVSLREAKGGER